MKPNILVGKTISAVFLAEDRMAIKFDIDGGEPLVVKTDGDCCSHSWIENVENLEALIGTPVLSVENLDLPEQERNEDEYEVIAYYGLKISTAKGDCVLDYRNESNGYYGGNLVWPDGDYFYGGVYGQNKSKEEWKPLS